MTILTFKSGFADHLHYFLRHKRGLGYKYDSGAYTLKQFDQFALEHYPSYRKLTQDLVHSWMLPRPGESLGTRHIRCRMIRQFGLFLHSLQHEAYVMPQRVLPPYRRYVPYIFSDSEIAALFAQIDSCRFAAGYPFRHLRLPILFRLLYGCGMRVSEAVNLRVGDVDLVEGIVTVKAGKFGKDRRVPMSADLTQRCRSYAAAVDRFSTTEQYVFRIARDNRPVSVTTVYFNFREFLLDAGISHGGKGKGPRVHDLRHTFAVHCLRRWVAEGKNLPAYLPILQTYLGHSHVKQTTEYLRLTPDLYPAIRDQIEERFATMIPYLGDGQ